MHPGRARLARMRRSMNFLFIRAHWRPFAVLEIQIGKPCYARRLLEPAGFLLLLDPHPVPGGQALLFGTDSRSVRLYQDELPFLVGTELGEDLVPLSVGPVAISLF